MKLLFSLFISLFLFQCNANINRPNLSILDMDIPFEKLSTFENDWVEVGKGIQNFGTSRPPLWVKTKLENTTNLEQVFILELGVSYLDHIEYYQVTNGNLIFKEKSGVFSNPKNNQIFHRNPCFRIKLAPKEITDIYFKLSNSGLLTAPLRIWNETDFINKTQGEYIIHGLYFGAMISLLFYNLFIYYSIRERSFLYYCSYILSVFFVYLILGGFLKQFFTPNHTFFIKPGLFIVSYLTIFSVLQFTNEFLEISKFNVRWAKILSYSAYFSLGMAIISPFLDFGLMVRSMNVFLPLGSLLMIISAVYGYNKGVKQSEFFLLAWIIVTIGVLLETLTNLGYIPMEFWLGRFGTQLSSLLEVILFSIAIGRRIKSLTLEKERVNAKLLLIEKDLDVARKIQNRILPLHIPKVFDAKISVTYLPLHAVGGDFYDFHEFDENKLGILLADVTGHGVSAAMDSSTVKIAFRNEKQWMHSPNKLLSNMNQFLLETLDQRFVSAVYSYIDLQNGKMTFATAGHPPIILIRKDQIVPLESEGFLLGFITHVDYNLYTLNLEKGDKLLFYTDGLNDDISIENTSTEVLIEVMRELKNKSSENYITEIINSLNKKRSRISDDITVLLVEL